MKQADPASVFGSNTSVSAEKQNTKNKELKSDGVHSVSTEEFQNALKSWARVSTTRSVWKDVLADCCRRALQLRRILSALICSEYITD